MTRRKRYSAEFKREALRRSNEVCYRPEAAAGRFIRWVIHLKSNPAANGEPVPKQSMSPSSG